MHAQASKRIGEELSKEEKPDLLAACVASRKVIRASDQGIDHTEVHAHIPHCLAAHWAGIVVASVLRKAVAVHEVSTRQLLQHERSVSAKQHPEKPSMRRQLIEFEWQRGLRCCTSYVRADACATAMLCYAMLCCAVPWPNVLQDSKKLQAHS